MSVDQVLMAESFVVHGRDEGGPFVLVSDHAGRAIPPELGDLGLSAQERARHIGWDIGIDGVGRKLADRLPAVLIEQVYSRLVIDCNRAPGHPTSIVQVTDGTTVPRNQNISAQDRTWREQTILHPYHARIRQELDAMWPLAARRWLWRYTVLRHPCTANSARGMQDFCIIMIPGWPVS